MRNSTTTAAVSCCSQAYPEAEAAFQAALALDPGHRAALLNLAFALRAQARAAETNRRARPPAGPRPRQPRRSPPARPDANALGRHAEAITDLNIVLAHQPDHVEALSARGGAHWALGNFAAATTDLDRALSHDPALSWR